MKRKEEEGLEDAHVYVTYISSAIGVTLHGWKLKPGEEVTIPCDNYNYCDGPGSMIIMVPDYTKPDKERIIWDKIYESGRGKSGLSGEFEIGELHMYLDMVPHIKEDTKIEPIEALIWISAVGYKQKLIYVGIEDSFVYKKRAERYGDAKGIAKSVYMAPDDVVIRKFRKKEFSEGLDLGIIKLEEPKAEELYDYINSLDASNISWWGVTALSAQTGASQEEKKGILELVKAQGEWAVKKAREQLSTQEAERIEKLWEEKYKTWKNRKWNIKLF